MNLGKHVLNKTTLLVGAALMAGTFLAPRALAQAKAVPQQEFNYSFALGSSRLNQQYGKNGASTAEFQQLIGQLAAAGQRIDSIVITTASSAADQMGSVAEAQRRIDAVRGVVEPIIRNSDLKQAVTLNANVVPHSGMFLHPEGAFDVLRKATVAVYVAGTRSQAQAQPVRRAQTQVSAQASGQGQQQQQQPRATAANLTTSEWLATAENSAYNRGSGSGVNNEDLITALKVANAAAVSANTAAVSANTAAVSANTATISVNAATVSANTAAVSANTAMLAAESASRAGAEAGAAAGARAGAEEAAKVLAEVRRVADKVAASSPTAPTTPMTVVNSPTTIIASPGTVTDAGGRRLVTAAGDGTVTTITITSTPATTATAAGGATAPTTTATAKPIIPVVPITPTTVAPIIPVTPIAPTTPTTKPVTSAKQPTGAAIGVAGAQAVGTGVIEGDPELQAYINSLITDLAGKDAKIEGQQQQPQQQAQQQVVPVTPVVPAKPIVTPVTPVEPVVTDPATFLTDVEQEALKGKATAQAGSAGKQTVTFGITGEVDQQQPSGKQPKAPKEPKAQKVKEPKAPKAPKEPKAEKAQKATPTPVKEPKAAKEPRVRTAGQVYEPKLSVKTNLAYWAAAMANAEVEYHFADRWSVAVEGIYADWNMNTFFDNLAVNSVSGEGRYWFGPNVGQYKGLYVGVYGHGGEFDYKLGEIFGTEKRGYTGYYYGGGLSVGAYLPLTRNQRLGLDLGLRAGLIHAGYDSYNYNLYTDGKYYPIVYKNNQKTNYFGITGAKVSLLYRFGW